MSPSSRHVYRAASAALLVALVGCAQTPAATQADPALASVDGAIERSTKDLPEFTAASTAAPKAAKEKGPTISLDYAGEAKVLLKRLAVANGMSFAVLGPQPYLPLFVVVNVKDSSLHDVLRDIGEQLGERADLALGDKSIEVRYRGR